MNRPNLARELRHQLSDPLALVTALGLIGDKRRFVRQHGYVLVCCPAHEEHSPSLSVRIGNDGTIACHCFGCDWSGDALDLIGEVHDVGDDFPQVLKLASELAGQTHTTPPQRANRMPRPSTRGYPRLTELVALVSSCIPVTEDAEVCSLLRSRGIEPDRVAMFDLARALPKNASLPHFARYTGKTWTETGHRLLLPVFNHKGEFKSARAWRVIEGDTPKRLPPSGHLASGLVLACTAGRTLLKGEREDLPSPLRIIFVEGEPDFLIWASQFSDADADAPIVFGVGSGWWTDAFAARVPDGAQVVIRTHADEAGDRYAAHIATSLKGRCDVMRPISELAA